MITVADKLKLEAEYQTQITEHLGLATRQAEQEIDNYLEHHPGFQVPRTQITAYNTAKSDLKAPIFGRWQKILQGIRQLYTE